MIRHALAPVYPAAAAALNLPRTIGTTGLGVALTFDDGPHPEGTPAVLEALARADARAMFFVVGEQVQRRPALVAEIAAAGHAVALHGYRHRLQLRLGDRTCRTVLGHAMLLYCCMSESTHHVGPITIQVRSIPCFTGRK